MCQNIADFLRIADSSENFLREQWLLAKYCVICVSINAQLIICIGKTREKYILYQENLHDVYICVFIVLLNLNLNLNLSFNIRSEGV